MPGRTFSPRPTSRLRVGLRTGRHGNVARAYERGVEVVKEYFDALSRRDVEAMAALWAPDGEEHIASQVDAVGPNGVRAYFTELFTAFPDFALTVQTTVARTTRSPCTGRRPRR